jgi:hypothetical protein
MMMIRSKVQFTGLELDPEAVADRWHQGIIPLNWHHHWFTVTSIDRLTNRLCQWLFNNIEGKWSIWTRRVKTDMIEVHLAFENDFDGVTFVLADGKTKALREDI